MIMFLFLKLFHLMYFTKVNKKASEICNFVIVTGPSIPLVIWLAFSLAKLLMVVRWCSIDSSKLPCKWLFIQEEI